MTSLSNASITGQIYDPRLIPWTGGNEGAVLRWYRDPTGTPTIGYGFTWGSRIFRNWWMVKHGRKMRAGDTISKSDAILLLGKLIDEDYAPPVIAALNRSTSTVTRHGVSAAIDMAYNCGAGSLKWSWFRLLLAGDIKGAAAKYRVTAQTSKGRKLPGLVRRRKEGAAILERNIWPDWVLAPASLTTRDIARSLPTWRLRTDDHLQGLIWLEQLKVLSPGHRGDARAIRQAVLTFQSQHLQLANDGILGRATLDQIQRVVDLKAKARTTGAGGGAVAGSGAADQAAGVSGYGDVLLYGGLALTLAVLGYFAWQYRDELALALKSYRRKL